MLKYHLPDIIRRLIFSWLSAVTFAYLRLSENQRSLEDLTGLKEMSFSRMLLTFAAVFLTCSLLSRLTKADIKKWERCGILILFSLLSISALRISFSVSFLCAVLLVGVLIGVYVIYGWNGEDSLMPCRRKNSKLAPAIAAAFALLFFAFVSVWTIFRVLTYAAPTFDFGIFSQMFYQMKTSGLPKTTLERDGLLSHFRVHVSPIYYLLLPFYWLCPIPAMLQLLQAAVLASAVYPAWKLSRKHGCPPFAAVLFCLMLLLYPSYSGGASYDLHENAFLTPLLLWLFYAIDFQKGLRTAVFGILTLMVKEDAAVYTAVIALWLLLQSLLRQDTHRRWKITAGSLLFAVSIIWFVLVTGYLTKYGDGVMTYRYNNFMYENSSSLVTVIKAVLLSPMKALYECAEQEKLAFLALTMLPLCGIPLATRKYERFLLLIPYILVNLMSDYRYQHDIFFQYTYGSTACLFYLTLINYADISAKIRNAFLKYTPLLLGTVISGILFSMVVVPKAVSYPRHYINQREHYKSIAAILQLIPDHTSVTASAFYTVPLANRDILYDVRYSSKEHLLSTEYVVLEVHQTESYAAYAEGENDGYHNLTALLEENGYVIEASLEDTLVIYHKEG